MNTRKLAVQMYTLRDYCKTSSGLATSLERVRKIGYRAVQLSGVEAMQGDRPAVSAEQARSILDDLGMRCIATHRSWQSLSRDTQREIEFHQALGCDYTAIGMMPPEYGFSQDGFARFLRDAQPVGDRLASAGIRLGYHNHSAEFVRIGPQQRTLFDLLVEAGDWLQLEIDTYWAAHGGLDPARLLRRCAGRIAVVHVKDMEVIPGDGPAMAPVGEGNLDWTAVLSACERGGTEWYAVEQDTCRRDPFDCLKSSFEFLGEQMALIRSSGR